MNNRVTVHICTKDRHSELGLLLQSLRTQTYKNWDIVLLDDASGGHVLQCQFLGALFARIKLEGHKIKFVRNEISQGCCAARNKCIDEDDFDNAYTFRCDDDVILEPDYIERLLNVIAKGGYDLASGVVPLLAQPVIKRKLEFIKPIINEHKLDDTGALVMNKDDCGFCYLEEVVIPTHQFRTNCLYKSEINKKVRYPDILTTVAFREEGFFSFKAIIEGYKIGVDTGAVAWHLQTPSGGNRRPDYAECVKIDEESWRKWIKKEFDKHGDFLEKYNKEVINNAEQK